MLKTSHGYDFVVLERAHVVRALWDKIPDQSYVQVNKRVNKIHEDSEGVRVETTDGSVYEGDIAVACDGVNSFVRDHMWDNANRFNPGLIPAEEKTCKHARIALGKNIANE